MGDEGRGLGANCVHGGETQGPPASPFPQTLLPNHEPIVTAEPRGGRNGGPVMLEREATAHAIIRLPYVGQLL